MITLDSFMAHSADGMLVPVIPGGHNVPLTFFNKNSYVERALHYRLHEMDRQVSASPPDTLELCYLYISLKGIAHIDWLILHADST